MAPVQRRYHRTAEVAKKRRSLTSIENTILPSSSAPVTVLKAPPPLPMVKTIASIYHIPKKGQLFPPSSRGALGLGITRFGGKTMVQTEEEYIPQPISAVFPPPMAYQPSPVAPMPSTPVAKKLPSSAKPIKEAKTSAAVFKVLPLSTPKATKIPSTPSSKALSASSGGIQTAPTTPTVFKVPRTPAPPVKEASGTNGAVKKRSKVLPDMERPTSKRQKLSRSLFSEDEAGVKAEKSRKEQNTARSPSSSSASSSQKSTKKPKVRFNLAVVGKNHEKKMTTKIPRLFTLCERQVLQEAYETQVYDCSSDVHVPFNILRPLLEKYSAYALYIIEITMPWLESGIESIWRKRLARDFPSSRLFPLETYGEAYRRCVVERADSF